MATRNPILETIEQSASAAKGNSLPKGLVSADSHVTEPPNCYVDYIDPAFRDRAPRMEHAADRGSVFVIDGIPNPVPMAIIAAAGIDPREITQQGRQFEDLHRGGWDGKARMADQDKDGVAAEVIYPSVGMVMCNHPDADYKQACMWAYNRWLHDEFCAAAPDRLIGLGQTAVRSVAEAVTDFQRIKEMGFKGVMLPGNPATEVDYDDVSFDPLWRAATELNLPVSFHISTSSSDRGTSSLTSGAALRHEGRGRILSRGNLLLKSIQDLIGVFIWGGVFDRHPDLKVVCVEADAGWAPHFMFRMEHNYKRHRFWTKSKELAKLPSAYFAENIYLTFQDDWTAFRMTDMMNPRHLLWANDFPHSDATWPWSQELLLGQTAHLSMQEKNWILRDNTAELYGITLN